MIVGIVSLVLSPYSHWVPIFPPIATIISLHAVIQSVRLKSRRSRWMAIVGLVSSALSIMPSVMMISEVQSGRMYKDSEYRCISNMKQIGLAMRLYADDNDGKWPSASHWRPLVQGYTSKENNVFQCLSATDKLYSYGMNINTSGIVDLTFSNPAKTAATFDCSLRRYNAFGGRESVDFRHKNGHTNIANFAFVDGHASAVVDGKTTVPNEMAIDHVLWNP